MFYCCCCNRRRAVVFVLCFILPTIWSQDPTVDGSGGINNRSCLSVKSAWISKGYGSHMIPIVPVAGDELEICRPPIQHGASTCCTRQMELKLYNEATQTLNKILNAKMHVIKEMFQARATKFTLLCQQLIDESSRELDALFFNTYGATYQNNTEIFGNLFRQLKSYFNGGADIDLTDVLDSFFVQLMQRLFTLLKSQYSFNEQFLSCVDIHLESISPFGDVPQRVAVPLKRAFVASRTFYQGLTIGRDAIAALERLELTQPCFKAATRMLYCQHCHSAQFETAASVKPCHSLCLNVMRGCLAQLYEVDEAWNLYLDSLLKLADRLQGSFNLETAIRPIAVKISEGIMNFQEDEESISMKVFQACGQPRFIGDHRTRRNAVARNAFRQRQRGQPTASPRTAANEGSFNSALTDISKRLQVTRGFWSSLPDTVCGNVSSHTASAERCWNGYNLTSRYTSPVVRPALAQQINNSEVAVSTRRINVIVERQILLLKIMTNRLKNAYVGLDVDWLDTFESPDASGDGGSGEGDIRDISGSGLPDPDDRNIDIAGGPAQPLPTLRTPRTTMRPVVSTSRGRVGVPYEKPTTRSHRPYHHGQSTTTAVLLHSSSTTVATTSVTVMGIASLTVVVLNAVGC